MRRYDEGLERTSNLIETPTDPEQELTDASCPAGTVALVEEQLEEDDSPVAPHTQAHKDFMTNWTIMVRWSPETRSRLVMEFIRDAGLFSQLNEYLKKKIR